MPGAIYISQDCIHWLAQVPTIDLAFRHHPKEYYLTTFGYLLEDPEVMLLAVHCRIWSHAQHVHLLMLFAIHCCSCTHALAQSPNAPYTACRAPQALPQLSSELWVVVV